MKRPPVPGTSILVPYPPGKNLFFCGKLSTMDFNLNNMVRQCQTVSYYGVAGFLGGAAFGGSAAIVNTKSVLSYGLRSGVNTAVIGCCIGGINETLAAVRGTRDPINPAIACGISGFLASAQRAAPKRAGLVGLLCAGAGVVGHYGWEEGTQRFEAMKRKRREELGIAEDEQEAHATTAMVAAAAAEAAAAAAVAAEQKNREEAAAMSESSVFKFSPVRRITDEEIEERRRIDAKRR